MLHYSLGDSLRSWMRERQGTPLVAEIQDRLDNQGFLTAGELSPFLRNAIDDAIRRKNRGIIVDGFPRYLEQLQSFDAWVAQGKLPTPSSGSASTKGRARPDIVLLFDVTENNARLRYLARGRDSNDSKEKFEKRFREYQRETSVVETEYEQRGILLRVSIPFRKSSNTNKGRSIQMERCRRTSPD